MATKTRYLGSGGVAAEAAALRPRFRARLLRSLSPFPEPEEDKGWGLAGRRRGKPRGRRRAAGLRSKAAGGHFTSGAVRGPSRPSTSPTLGRHSSPTLAPLGAAPRRRPDPAGGENGEGAGPGRACRGLGARSGAAGAARGARVPAG